MHGDRGGYHFTCSLGGPRADVEDDGGEWHRDDPISGPLAKTT
jgi:hypothetical protein